MGLAGLAVAVAVVLAFNGSPKVGGVSARRTYITVVPLSGSLTDRCGRSGENVGDSLLRR